MHITADVVTSALLGVLVALLAANVVAITARLSHNEKLAQAIYSFASRIVWVFRMGDSRDQERDRRHVA